MDKYVSIHVHVYVYKYLFRPCQPPGKETIYRTPSRIYEHEEAEAICQ